MVCLALAFVLVGILYALAGLMLRDKHPHVNRRRLSTTSFVRPEDYPQLQIPDYHHVEVAMDPPQGLCFNNPQAPYSFENEFVSATFIYATMPPESTPGSHQIYRAGGLDFQTYFTGKKRLWELRFQFRFKKRPPPGSNMFFGFKLEEFHRMRPNIRRAMKLAVYFMSKIAGGIYYSLGDDPGEVKNGECEQPVVVLPMWAFDQFIETPEGQEPPKITDADFPQLGSIRKGRVSDYVREVADFEKNCRPGPTYTFAHWGTSRFVNFLNWSLDGIPQVTPLGFDSLTGGSLVQVVCYSLRAPEAGSKETRHLSSRKDYYFKARIWDPAHRPGRLQFEALTAAEQAAPDDDSTSSRPGSPMRGIEKGRGCCGLWN